VCSELRLRARPAATGAGGHRFSLARVPEAGLRASSLWTCACSGAALAMGAHKPSVKPHS
jgi:hypothetical protein